MGYIVDTQLPTVLQEREVQAINGYQCYERSQRRLNAASTMPAWLGFGACFIGSKTGTR